MQVTGWLVPPASHVALPSTSIWAAPPGGPAQPVPPDRCPCAKSGNRASGLASGVQAGLRDSGWPRGLELASGAPASGARAGLGGSGWPRGPGLASGAGAGLRPWPPALRPWEEHCARPLEREGLCLSGHQVPRSPSKASRGRPGLHAHASGGEGLDPTDSSFGPLSKPRFPSPTSAMDANSILGQPAYPSLQAQQTLHHLRRQERRDGGSHKGPWIPYRSPSPGPAVTAICLPSPRPSASGLSTQTRLGCGFQGGSPVLDELTERRRTALRGEAAGARRRRGGRAPGGEAGVGTAWLGGVVHHPGVGRDLAVVNALPAGQHTVIQGAVGARACAGGEAT